MSYGTVQAEKMTTESGYSLGAGNASSFKNRIINGEMDIDQRNAGASVNASVVNASVYMLDRWRYYANTGASRFSYQQNAGSVTAPPGFSNYLGITSLTANSPAATDEYIISQFIEGFNIADLGWGTANAKAVTVSFWVRSSLTGSNFGACVKSANAGYTFPFNFSIPAANTWTFITVTIPGPTIGLFGSTNGVGLQLLFNLGTGSTYLAGTSGAWTTTFSNAPTGSLNILGTNGATFYLTGVQFEVGTVATSFDFRSIGTELALCQRYYFRKASGTASALGLGSYYSTTQLFTMFDFPVQMRASPSLDASSGTNYYRAAVNSTTDGFDSLSLDGASTSTRAILITSSNVSGTVGWSAMVYADNASAYVGLTAEL